MMLAIGIVYITDETVPAGVENHTLHRLLLFRAFVADLSRRRQERRVYIQMETNTHRHTHTLNPSSLRQPPLAGFVEGLFQQKAPYT